MSDASTRTGAGSRRWYRSLYWRIALGLFAFLALMLAAQGALFLWVADQMAGSMPARSPRRLAFIVASDVGAALETQPTLNLEQYIRDEYGHVLQPFVVLMRDGRTVSNHSDEWASPELVAALRDGANRAGPIARFRRPPPGTSSVESPRQRMPPRNPDESRNNPGVRRRAEFARVFVGREVVGTVAVVLGGPPFRRVVRQLGPTMALVGGGVLLVGTALIAVLVFGPARRRLRQVQEATVRLGAGDLAARAPEHGGDEVAEVASSFNRMADELSARAQALEASHKARRQLLADVSHELMTPLTAMRGYVETLSMRELSLDSATRERYLAIVAEETHRLERIIGDLLDLARLEGGGTPIKHEPVSVSSLFERVRARHERESDARRIQLSVDVTPGAEIVDGDADRLEQALQNLAANALRHTPDQGAIALTALPVDGTVRIRVRDNGEGIPAEHLPLIFDRFYKADAARRQAGGSGLGLSIVKAIVEQHGGTVSAHNDDGAVFEIDLPRPRVRSAGF
jgi:two-component system, OmpR family, sensor kinase